MSLNDIWWFALKCILSTTRKTETLESEQDKSDDCSSTRRNSGNKAEISHEEIKSRKSPGMTAIRTW